MRSNTVRLVGAFDDGVKRSEVFLPYNPWFSVHAFGLDGVVIGPPFFNLFGYAGHGLLHHE